MKKLLTLILIILLIVLAATLVTNGIKIGDFQILSLKQLIQANVELDEKILEADKITKTDYKAELNKLDKKMNELQSNKKRYEELMAITSDKNFELASREETYKLEYLYYQLGEIAKKNDVDIKIEISTGSSGANGLYDITLITSYEGAATDESGYVKLTDFIYEVENDETLGFKVEDFSLIPYDVSSKSVTREDVIVNEKGETETITVTESVAGYGLRGTFTAKNIAIQDISDSILEGNDSNTSESGDITIEENINNGKKSINIVN